MGQHGYNKGRLAPEPDGTCRGTNLNGWIRLGLALSAAWLVVIGYLAYEERSGLSRTKKYEVAKDGLGAVIFVFSAAQNDSEIELDIQQNLAP